MIPGLPLPVVQAGLAASFVAAAFGMAMWFAQIEQFGIAVYLLLLLMGGWPVAFAHALVVAPPIFRPMIASGHLRWWSAPPAGALVGAGPMAGMMVVSTLLGMAMGRRVDPVNWAPSLALFAVSGAIGGLVFWAVTRGGKR
ncbi:MAG: hypothetical protein V4574_03840 [Pseudomonadota bacterium]